MTQPPRRIRRDNSVLPLMLGPVGIGIPKWIVLVVLYFVAVFATGWSGTPGAIHAMNVIGALGPGVIGLIDLSLRLRTTHYEWINPGAGLVVTEANLADRLTFRECGWYLPLLGMPLPLWMVGIGVSAAFVNGAIGRCQWLWQVFGTSPTSG